jgi:hypothetical protein
MSVYIKRQIQLHEKILTLSTSQVKSVPLHDMKVYRRAELWLHSFLTSALDGGEWPPHTPDALPLGKEHPVPIERETGWAPEPVMSF